MTCLPKRLTVAIAVCCALFLPMPDIAVMGPDVAHASDRDGRDKDRDRERGDRGNGRDKDKDRGARGNGRADAARERGLRAVRERRAANQDQVARPLRVETGDDRDDGDDRPTRRAIARAAATVVHAPRPVIRDRRRAALAALREELHDMDLVDPMELVPPGDGNAAASGGNGNIRAQMGALNAANASDQALANASAKSRVGLIGVYRDAVLEGERIVARRDRVETLLNTLDEPERTRPEVTEDLAAVTETIADLEATIADLEAGLADGTTDRAVLVAARDSLAEAESAAQDLREERRLVVLYNRAELRLSRLDQRIDLAAQDAVQSLIDAGNKDITPDVVTEVNRLLGLPLDAIDGALLDQFED